MHNVDVGMFVVVVFFLCLSLQNQRKFLPASVSLFQTVVIIVSEQDNISDGRVFVVARLHTARGHKHLPGFNPKTEKGTV